LECQLEPKQRADEAAKIILRRMLEVMHANEAHPPHKIALKSSQRNISG
jgi:hypothetical protein